MIDYQAYDPCGKEQKFFINEFLTSHLIKGAHILNIETRDDNVMNSEDAF